MADLNALLVFAGVAETGGFSAGARRLGMPVSTVSRQVASLEDRLGTRLIERSTRNLRLTDAGARLLEQARHAVELSGAVDRLATEGAGSVSGLLRLSVPPGIAEALVVPVAAAFGTSYPHVQMHVSVFGHPGEETTDRADLMVRFGAQKNSSLVALKLLRFRRRLLASQGYIARYGMPVQPADLACHRMLTLQERTPSRRWQFVQQGGERRHTLEMRPHLITDDAGALVAAALDGAGICELPPMTRPDLLRDGRLVEVVPGWKLEAADLSLIHLGRRHVPRHVQLFKDMAASMIPDLFPDLPC